MSEVVNEIERQLRSLGVNLSRKKLVKIDDNTLRIHTPSSGIGKADFKSVDIRYDKGRDLYDVSIHTANKKHDISTCKSKGVYFDSLPDFFNKKITSKMKCD